MIKISVLMPVYNTGEEYLRQAIESILGQTYRDFEFIIINDASTNPRIEEVVHSYHDERIRYFVNDQNMGISETRNRLIDLASGEYLAVMDHDDISLPLRFEREAAFLDSHPEVGVVSCWYESFPHFPGKKIRRPFSESNEIDEELMFSNLLLHPAAMIRKSVLDQNNVRYEAIFSPCEDYALWARLIGKTKFAILPEILFRYRNHRHNTSHRQKQRMDSTTLEIQAFARAGNPDLWYRAENTYGIKKQWRLFGFLPLITSVARGRKTNYYLFGFLFCGTAKTKRVR